jgi:AcrR family transcriptional regulator
MRKQTEEPSEKLPSWASRALVRSVQVQRSQDRAVSQAQSIVDAAQRLVNRKGVMFTTQEVVKEANVALQTLYRHFGGIDELALAVIETMVADAAQAFEASAEGIEDPIDRLRHFIQLPLMTLKIGENAAMFLATERWRLQRLFPDEIEHARQPFKDLVERELVAARQAGRADLPNDPSHDARLLAELMTAVYYDTAVSQSPEPLDVTAERLWLFCRAALGLHSS